MRKRIIGWLFIALLFCGAQIASASTFTLAGFDGQDSNHNWADNQFFVRMQEKTGVSFQLSQYTDYDKWQQAKNEMFTSGNLPDVLFKADLSVAEQQRYGGEGLLIDLLPLLQANAPNLWALFQSNPEWLKAVTLPDGKVVALPTINTLPAENAMWINQTWLDALGLSQPTDLDSLIAVLTAFQTKDPNNNGRQDEIPLSFLGPWDLKFLAHAFGLVANDYNIYVDEAGQVRFMPLEDKFIDYLKTLASMYKQGLLDHNGFMTADSLRAVSDSKAAVTYGMFFGPNPFHLFPIDLGAQFTLLEPLAYDGRQIYRDIFGPITTGSFAITSACQHPEELLAWVDTLYSRDGAVEAMAGAEGEDYNWNDDGTWSYSLALQTESSYILYDLSIYDSGNMPWLFPVDFYAAYDTASLRKTTDSLLGLQPYLVSPFPYSYVLSPDQRNFIDPMQLSLGAYVDESIAKFILGELDINSKEDIDAFYSGLGERGVQDFVSFWQEIYDQQRIR
jgi:putative aldouronate transport system substrate-binding protein